MRFIDSGNMLVQRHTIEVPVGQYEAFFMHMSGTNAGGATLAMTDFNNLRCNRNGMDFVNVNFDNLMNLSDMIAGMVNFASAIGAAFNLGFHVPMAFPGFPNILTVADEDVMKIHLDLGNLAAIVAAGTWEIYGIIQSGVERYIPVQVQDSVALAAAGAQEKRKAPTTNISDIWAFPSVAANFAKLTVERDDEIVSDANYAPQAAWTNLKNRKEATAVAVAHTPVAIGLRPDELLSESIYVIPLSQTGAVTIEFVYYAAQFDKGAIFNSRNALDSRIQRNVNKKTTQGKSNEADLAIAQERVARAEEKYSRRGR